ncbi:MAG: hypothetical protein ACTSUE_26350 [Promethearchaeota archaeon]
MLCPLGQCYTETDGCLDSKFGVLCTECNNNGYLEERTPSIGFPETNICVCYDPSFDPTANVPCSSLTVLKFDLDLTTHLDRALCDPHQHELLGFFKLSGNPNDHYYGLDNPPVPNACLREIWGPEPGQNVETFRRPLQTCNTYCGPDPNQFYGPLQESACFTCSKHGNWNPNKYRCECHDQWTLRKSPHIGKDPGIHAYLCDKCQPLWGPSVPGDGEYLEIDRRSAPYCHQIWTPDPETGIESECGGHGTFGIHSKQCGCFANETHGHWDLEPFTFEFTELAWDNGGLEPVETKVNRTALTCMKCAFPYIPDPLVSQSFPMPVQACSIDSSLTLKPTVSPVQAPAPPNDTLVEICQGCNATDVTIVENAILYPSTIVNITTLGIVPNMTACGCNFTNMFEDPLSLIVTGGGLPRFNLTHMCEPDSIDDYHKRNNVAFTLCAEYPPEICEMASWYLFQVNTGSEFINAGYALLFGFGFGTTIDQGEGHTAGGVNRCEPF